MRHTAGDARRLPPAARRGAVTRPRALRLPSRRSRRRRLAERNPQGRSGRQRDEICSGSHGWSLPNTGAAGVPATSVPLLRIPDQGIRDRHGTAPLPSLRGADPDVDRSRPCGTWMRALPERRPHAGLDRTARRAGPRLQLLWRGLRRRAELLRHARCGRRRRVTGARALRASAARERETAARTRELPDVWIERWIVSGSVRGSSLVIDVCGAHGVWLDAAELVSLVEAFRQLEAGTLAEEASPTDPLEAALLRELQAAEAGV